MYQLCLCEATDSVTCVTSPVIININNKSSSNKKILFDIFVVGDED